MADTKRTWELILGAKDVNVTKTLKGIEKSFQSVGDGLTAATQPLTDFQNGILAIDAALGAALLTLLKFSSDSTQALDRLRAQTGASGEQLEQFGDIARDVYTGTLVDSIDEGAEAVRAAFQTLGQTSEEALRGSVEGALLLKKTFDADVSESVSAAKSLMDNFGVTSEEAFNLITKGFRSGLDRSGDFLDTVNEYSVQFKEGGASAQQFFGFLESGLQGGVLGTDKAADAFKEFRVRIQDGSKTTKEALELIGIGADDFQKKLSSGSITTAQAFEQVVTAIKSVEDPARQMAAGTGLLGTQFEDLGNSAALSLNIVSDKFDDVSGAVKSLEEQNISAGKAFTKTWRGIADAITNTEVFKQFEQNVSGFLLSIGQNFEQAFKDIDLSGVESSLGELLSQINTNLSALFGDVDLTTVEGLQSAIQTIVDSIESVIDISSGIAEAWEPFIRVVGDIIESINNLDEDARKTIGNIVGIGSQLGLLAGGITGLSVLAGGFTNIISILGKMKPILGFFLAGPGSFLALAAAAGVAFGTILRLIPGIDSFVQKLIELGNIAFGGKAEFKIGEDVEATQAKANALLKYRRNIAAAAEKTKEAQKNTEEATDSLKGWSVEAQSIAAVIEKGLEFAPEVDTSEITEASKFIKDEFGRLKPKVSVAGEIDAESWKDTGEYIEEFYTVNGEERSILVSVEPDQKSVDDTIETLTEIQKTKLEIQAKLDVANIEAETARFESSTQATTERIQSFLEFKANIEIAKAENDLKRFEAALESTSSLIVGLSDSSAGLFSQFSQDLDMRALWMLEDQIRQNLRIQKEEFDLQKQLIELEIERNRIRNELLRDNATKEIKFSIDERVNPALRAVMIEIIGYVQAQANLEGYEALLGVE